MKMKNKVLKINLILSLAVLLALIGLTGTSGALDDPALYGSGPEKPEVHIPPDSSIKSLNASGPVVTNGDFETGDLSGWGLYHAGNTWGWLPYSGTVSPMSGMTIEAPPQGIYAATSDQLGPSVQILYQDITLSEGLCYELQFTLYYRNWNNLFFTPDDLTHTSIPNQQYRVDIMDPAAPVLSVSPGDVLANVFQTQVGDPLTLGPTPITFDLSPFAGQTVRLRLAEVDNQWFFNASVDDVRIEVVIIPVSVDIKPGSCPNPLNLKSKGVLPVAVLGTEDLDITTIDPTTIRLSREGVEGEVRPIRSDHEDVATPFEGELCDCHELNGDGYPDLTLKFKTQELVETLGLGEVAGETIPLTLTGELMESEGGTPIKGEDCVLVLDVR